MSNQTRQARLYEQIRHLKPREMEDLARLWQQRALLVFAHAQLLRRSSRLTKSPFARN